MGPDWDGLSPDRDGGARSPLGNEVCSLTLLNFLTMNPKLSKSKGPILYTNFLCFFSWYEWYPRLSPPSLTYGHVSASTGEKYL